MDEILSIRSNNEGNYTVMVGKDTSVEEVAFAISVLIRCFDRDKVIEKNNMLELINRYLNNETYSEVTDCGLA